MHERASASRRGSSMRHPLALAAGNDYGARCTSLAMRAPAPTGGCGDNMSNADRRFTYRLDLPEDRVRLHAPSVGRVVVADLSASGSGLIVSPDDFARVSAEPATFDFDTGQSFKVRLNPVRVAKVDQQLRVGARFQDLPVEGMRVLSQFLIREFIEENK